MSSVSAYEHLFNECMSVKFIYLFSITRLGLRMTNSIGCTDCNLPRGVDPPRCDVVIHRHGEDGVSGLVRLLGQRS